MVECCCRVINKGDKPFDFTAALHTYFEVLDLDTAAVKGMKGMKFLDKSQDSKNPTEKIEDREEVKFGDALIDSVYLDAPEYIQLDVGTGMPHAHAAALAFHLVCRQCCGRCCDICLQQQALCSCQS